MRSCRANKKSEMESHSVPRLSLFHLRETNPPITRSSGRLHLKSRTEQHFLEVALVPACGETFVLDADLQGGLILQQAQRGAAKDAEIGIGVALADAALVFLKGDIELPVQTVFDTPVVAHCVGESAAEMNLLRM